MHACCCTRCIDLQTIGGLDLGSIIDGARAEPQSSKESFLQRLRYCLSSRFRGKPRSRLWLESNVLLFVEALWQSRAKQPQFCTNICRSRLLVAALSVSHTCRVTAEFDTMTLVYSADCNSCMHPRIRIGGGEELHCEDAERKAPLPS
jgi:hypothetical protein